MSPPLPDRVGPWGPAQPRHDRGTRARAWASTSLGLALVLLLTGGCRSISEGYRHERARDLTRVVEDLALEPGAGNLERALDLLERKVDANPQGYDYFIVHFTRAWLHQLMGRREVDPELRIVHLEEAAGYYETALGLQPPALDTCKNLAYVLRDLEAAYRAREALGVEPAREQVANPVGRALDLVEEQLGLDPSPQEKLALLLLHGDLLIEAPAGRRSADLALASYTSAFEEWRKTRDLLDEDRTPAVPWTPVEVTAPPARIVGLHALALDPDRYRQAFGAARSDAFSAEELLDACDTFESLGLRDAASTGFEAVMLESAHGAIGDEPAARALVSWVRLHARRDTLVGSTSSLPAVRGDGDPLAVGLRGIEELIADPVNAEPNGFWNLEGRLDTFLMGLQSIARTLTLGAELDQAVLVLEHARRISNESALVSETKRLDVALDLVILYHAYREDIDGDYTNLKRLLGEPPLDSYRGDEATDASLEVQLERELVQVHRVLGLVYAEIGNAYEASLPPDGRVDPLADPLGSQAWSGKARFHLDRARYLAAQDENEELPRLATILGEGLGTSVGPLDAYLEAVEGYLAAESPRDARDVYRLAVEHSRREDQKLWEIEELVYPRSGWYAGLHVGPSYGDASSNEYQGLLGNMGHDVEVDLEDDQAGIKATVGYRFDGPFAAEFGWTALEGPTSEINELSGSPDPDLLQDILDTHPRGGQGITGALLYIPYERHQLQAFVKLGAWAWKANADFEVNDGTPNPPERHLDDEGVDLFGGVGLQMRLERYLGLRVEYERYIVTNDAGDGGEVDLLSLGLLFKF